MSRRALLRAGTGVLAAGALGVLPDLGALGARPAAGAVPGSTRFVPIRPTRLIDTRSAGGWTRLAVDRIRVPVAGRAGIPSSAVAVAATVSTADARPGGPAAGLVAVRPAEAATAVAAVTAGVPEIAADGLQPHLAAAGAHTQACFVQLGAGSLDLTHEPRAATLAVDVVGYFEPATAASAGRMITTAPARVADTEATADPFGPWEVRRIRPGDTVPGDATAVLVNLTTSGGHRPGRWTAFPGGTPPPTDTLVTPAGATRTAFAVVPLDEGAFHLLSSAGGHVAVDVVGHVTGEHAPTSADGLFVPEPPYRALDTRLVAQPIPVGSSREFATGPLECSAIAMSVITVAAPERGHAVVWGAGDARPTSSTIHYDDETAMSTFAVARAGRRGAALGVAGAATHAVVDVYGWFTGQRSDDLQPVVGAQPHGIHGIEMEAFADEWFDYGTSTDGRPLRAFRRGSGDRHALLTTGLHGDEHTGTSVLADVVTRDAIAGWTLWLVPVANPDARASNRRYVHDVDMNRDFPVDWSPLPSPTGSGCVTTRTGAAPHSLVESQRLADAMTSGPFRNALVSISHHDNYNWVAPQSGSPAALRHLADDYARATGLRLPGQGGGVVPTSPNQTRVAGGFETFAHSLGMSSFLVENRAGYVGGSMCAGSFGQQPAADDVAPHRDALHALLTDARLP